MDNYENKIKNHPSVDEIVLYSDKAPIEHFSDTYSFSHAFNSQVFSHTCISILSKARITPVIAQAIAKHYLMYFTKPMSFLMLIDKHMRIKDIVGISNGFKAKLSDFTDEIARACSVGKCKRCIIIYNYRYKRGEPDEIFNLNVLYNKLLKKNICLADAIRYYDHITENIILTYNKKGYEI